MKNIHYTFMAYDELNTRGEMVFPVEIGFDCILDEFGALEYAKSMMKRKHYYLRKVTVCSGH